ncbi:class I SAM-dependent methyltransferase [soil metagenome]
MELVNQKAENYSKEYTSPLDNILFKNEKNTLAMHEHAQMHSGHVQGKFLEMLSRMLKPKKVLEIGTFTGFSALCLSMGLQDGGLLHTIELREEDAATATAYFYEAGAEGKIKLHIGNALDIIPKLAETWDLIFIDADKVSYIDYYELTLPSLNKGGWILADNVLFHGQVLEDELKGKNARAIDAFNKHVAADARVEQIILTVRDGLMLIRKL